MMLPSSIIRNPVASMEDGDDDHLPPRAHIAGPATPQMLALQREVAELRSRLSVSMAAAESSAAVANEWRDKYDRLFDAHRRLQKTTTGLEDKLLRMVDRSVQMRSSKFSVNRSLIFL